MQPLSQQNSRYQTQALDHVRDTIEQIIRLTFDRINTTVSSPKLLLLNCLPFLLNQKVLLILVFSVTFLTTGISKSEQLVIYEPLTWDAGFLFDGRWRSYETSPGNTQDSKEQRFREQFSFKKNIHILDPGIATFSFDLRPTFDQNNYDTTAGANNDTDSTTLNYSANSSFLHGTKMPINLSAGINRTSGVTTQSLGARTDFDLKNQQLTFNLKNIYFPSFISYTTREQELIQESGFSSVLLHTHDRIHRLNYRGRSSKMNLSIEQMEYEDFIYNRNYTYNREQLTHGFHWGKNSHINSRIEHTEQQEFGAYENLNLTEKIRLQHTQNLYSSYQFDYKETERNVKTTSYYNNFDINHQLYTNLRTQFGYQQNTSRYSNGSTGESTTTGPKYSLNYSKKLPAQNSYISMGVNGSRLTTEQSGGTQIIDVIGYSKTFETDRILLEQRYIDITTIELQSSGGATYIEGIDYTITQAPSGYTEVYRIASGSGGNINPDETVSVNYSHWAPGNVSQTSGFFLRLNLDNFQLYHNQSANEQELNIDPASLINVTFPSAFSANSETRHSTTGLSYNLSKDKFKLALGLETQNTHLNYYETQSQTFKQSLLYSFNPLITLNTTLNLSAMETTLSKSDSFSASVQMNIRLPRSRITLKPHMNYRQLDDNLGNDDQYLNEGVILEWRYHLLSVNASLDHYQWHSNAGDNEDNRLMINLVRRSK
ncbi:MAG: hypothetical protein OEZ38_05250 [Gammaproteobacteria bacterium]|nr:hypothetical protein [Gammaproteobacteria bacterium]